MRRLISLSMAVAACLSTSSCMTVQEQTGTPAPNPRIEYRDLRSPFSMNDTNSAFVRPRNVSECEDMTTAHGDAGMRSATETSVSTVAQSPVFLDFANDSTALDATKINFDQLKAAAARGMDFFVVGQSHGVSGVGVDTLAVRRAKAVAKTLAANGIDAARIHTLASWSSGSEPFAPSRGVQIFVLDHSSDPSRALLALQGG